MNKRLTKVTTPIIGLPRLATLAMIRVYKITFSPLLFAGSCRFVPSCSTYAEEAVFRYGALRGSWLAVKRLLRCQPICSGGLDPVPDIGRREQS